MGEQMTGAEIQSKHHRILLDFRRQDYIIQTEAFEEAWDSANLKQKAEILHFLFTPTPDILRHWVTKIMLGGGITMEVLKRIARLHQIPNYSRMTKFELEDALLAQGIKL